MVSKVLEFDSDLPIPESDAHLSPADGLPAVDALTEEIDRCVAKECLFCGEAMISSIERPFIDKSENAEVLEWALLNW